MAVLCFSVSLPATRFAVRELGWVFVSFGRAVVAGALAIIVLTVTKTSPPNRMHAASLALPLTILLALVGLGPVKLHEPSTAWLGFSYLGVVSMYLGFFAWYAGLAMGGVAGVSQVQLLHPILSLTWAGIFLHEHLDALLVAVALVVFLAVFGSRRSAIATAPVAPTISVSHTASGTVQAAP